MSRYDGYTEPLEVMVDVLRELKKITEQLTTVNEKKDGGNDNERSNKPENTTPRERGNRRGGNNAK